MEIKQILKKGLTNNPKYIPVWYRYDKTGSILNDECAEKSPFYYFHNSEKTLLFNIIEELIGNIHFPSTVIDLGSGNSRKTRMIIDGILKQQDILKYVPVDISVEFLHETCAMLSKEYNGRLDVHPCPGDFLEGIKMMRNTETNVLLLLFGSLQGCPREEQLKLLTSVRTYIKDSDLFLLTVDITSDKETILNAYLYPGDISERFHLNAIERLNREMKGNIDLKNFSIERELYQSTDRDDTSSVQIFLKAKKRGVYRLDSLDMDITFEKGERFNLYEGEGTSHKYTIEQLRYLTKKAHLNIHRMWTNEHELTGSIHFPSTLIDLGSGNSKKTRMIIDGILKQQDILRYVPVDISVEFLQETCIKLSKEHNDRLDVHPCPGDFLEGIKMMGNTETNVLLLLFGSLQMSPREEQLKLLTSVRTYMKDMDIFLMSADITSDKETILNAYLYPGDFTVPFHLNAIERLNREMKGNIDLQNFSIERELYQSTDRHDTSRVQIFLKAKERGVYRLDSLDMDITFEKGERFNLYEGEGTSHKYTIEQLRYLTKHSPDVDK